MGNLCGRGPKREDAALHASEESNGRSTHEPGTIADTWHNICRKGNDGDAVLQVCCEPKAVPMTQEPLQPGFPPPLVMGAHGQRTITCNMWRKMPGWFDITSFDTLNGTGQDSQTDLQGINEATRYIHKLIQREVDGGIPLSRIVLAGLSQGGATVLSCLHQDIRGIGGIVGLSCWMPVKHQRLDKLEGTKVFIAHGKGDDLVTYGLGRAAAETMQANGLEVEFHDYDIPHRTDEREIQDMLDFISRVVPIGHC